MRRCKNGRIIPFLEAKMGFDSGPGIMYRGQALLLCQVIGKFPLTDAELVIKHASSRSYAQFDYFKPEFINRIDDIVFYKPLEQSEIRSIVGLMLKGLQARLASKEISVELTEAAVDAIAEAGFDPVYGARPLKRYMQSQLETMLARAIVAGDVLPGQQVVVDHDGNGLVLRQRDKLNEA